MTTEAGFTPDDADVARAREGLIAARDANAEHTGIHNFTMVDDLRAVLATIGPIIERERRAAKVEALREMALTNVTHSGVMLTPDGVSRWLRECADEIERE